MDKVEQIKVFLRKEIIANEEILKKATHEYLSELEYHFGKNKSQLNKDELDNLEHLKDVYRDSLKENEVLNYLAYEMFIKKEGEK